MKKEIYIVICETQDEPVFPFSDGFNDFESAVNAAVDSIAGYEDIDLQVARDTLEENMSFISEEYNMAYSIHPIIVDC